MKQLLLLLLMVPMLAAAQTKKPSKKPQEKLDVDRLYEKYKDDVSITIYTPEENITAYVKIKFDGSEYHPSSVILYGTYNSDNAISNVISGLVATKKKAGYKESGSGSEKIPDEPLENVTIDLYRKGTQYAKYGTSYYSSDIGKKKYFYFEVGDVSRRGTGKKETFTF